MTGCCNRGRAETGRGAGTGGTNWMGPGFNGGREAYRVRSSVNGRGAGLGGVGDGGGDGVGGFGTAN